MRNARLVSLVFALSLFSGCASSYLTRSARMFSSESEGEHEFSTELGPHELNRVYITDDIGTIPVNESNHELAQTATVGASGAFGVFEFLDVGLNYDLATAPMVFAKIQLLGDSKRKADVGNISLSAYASVGYQGGFTETGDGDLFSQQTPGTVNHDGHGVYEAGAIFGVRTSKKIILLFGGSVLWQDISGNQMLSGSTTPIYFNDYSRFTEVHLASLINFKGNDVKGFFITPMAQWGYMDSFGIRSYAVNVAVNLGYQFGAGEKRSEYDRKL